MSKKKHIEQNTVPAIPKLIVPTYTAFKILGDCLNAKQIHDFVVKHMEITDDILAIKQKNKNESAFWYNLRWARTDMRKAKILHRDSYNCWSLMPVYRDIEELDQQDKDKVKSMKQKNLKDVPMEFSVGVNLKCILRLLGVSIHNLSERISIPEKEIQSWTSMKSVITLKNVLPICKVLKISPYYLLTGDKSDFDVYSEEINLLQAYTKLSERSKGRLLERAEILLESE